MCAACEPVLDLTCSFLNLGGAHGDARKPIVISDIEDNPTDVALLAEFPHWMKKDVFEKQQFTDSFLSLWHVDGCAIMARRPLASRVTLEVAMKVDNTVKGKNRRSTFVIFTVHFGDGRSADSWTMLGKAKLVFLVAHIHHMHAKSKTKFDDCVQVLHRLIYEWKPVLMGVDANMGLFALGPALVGRGVPATLAAWNLLYKQELMPDNKSQPSGDMLFDSDGLFVLGDLKQLRPQPVSHKLLATASVSVDEHVDNESKFTTGFPLTSFLNSGNKHLDMLWRDDMNARLAANGPWTLEAVTLLWSSRRPCALDSSGNKCWSVNEKLRDRLHAAAVHDEPLQVTEVPAIIAALAADAGWMKLSRAIEFLQNPTKGDPTGQLLNHGAHFNCALKLSQGEELARDPALVGSSAPSGKPPKCRNFSDRSVDGHAQRGVKLRRQKIFRETGCWPWYIEHKTEGKYWTHSSIDDGQYGADCRGWKGLYWRLRQYAYIQEGREDEVAAYNQHWIDMYGRAEFDEAMQFTERYLKKALEDGLTYWTLPEDEHLQATPETLEYVITRVRAKEAKLHAA